MKKDKQPNNGSKTMTSSATSNSKFKEMAKYLKNRTIECWYAITITNVLRSGLLFKNMFSLFPLNIDLIVC